MKDIEYVQEHVKVPLWKWEEIQYELEEGRRAIKFREEFWRDIFPGIQQQGDNLMRAALAGAAVATNDTELAQTVLAMSPNVEGA